MVDVRVSVGALRSRRRLEDPYIRRSIVLPSSFYTPPAYNSLDRNPEMDPLIVIEGL